MPRQFREGSLSFTYPDNWALEREDSDDGWTVSLQSPDTAFVTVSLERDHPDVDYMAGEALNALREVYPELEADEAREFLAGQMAVGHDVDFFSLDLTNTCWTRCFATPDGTVLVLCQVTDFELPLHGPVLKAICASLRVD
jgi:hypothetical protein